MLYFLEESTIPVFSPVFEEVEKIQRSGRCSSLTRKQIQGPLRLYLSLSPLCLVDGLKSRGGKKRGGGGGCVFLDYLHCDR